MVVNLSQVRSSGLGVLSEEIHDASVIRMNTRHISQDIRLWRGDSFGNWEGDTLVVETSNPCGSNTLSVKGDLNFLLLLEICHLSG